MEILNYCICDSRRGDNSGNRRSECTCTRARVCECFARIMALHMVHSNSIEIKLKRNYVYYTILPSRSSSQDIARAHISSDDDLLAASVWRSVMSQTNDLIIDSNSFRNWLFANGFLMDPVIYSPAREKQSIFSEIETVIFINSERHFGWLIIASQIAYHWVMVGVRMRQFTFSCRHHNWWCQFSFRLKIYTTRIWREPFCTFARASGIAMAHGTLTFRRAKSSRLLHIFFSRNCTVQKLLQNSQNKYTLHLEQYNNNKPILLLSLSIFSRR